MDCSKLISKIKDSVAMILSLGADGKINGKGSGFVFHQKGLIVTCNHVVGGDNSKVKVKLIDTEKDFFDAQVVIRDEKHDLALLEYDRKITSGNPLKQAKPTSIKEGMQIMFAGYPLGLSHLTTHQGILSAILKDPTGLTHYLIDGTVNVGNSGCPLLNVRGEVVGIVNATRRERSDLLKNVEELKAGAVSLHGIDLIELYQALIRNLQLGMGYAIPCSYVPQYNLDSAVDDNNNIAKALDKKDEGGKQKIKK